MIVRLIAGGCLLLVLIMGCRKAITPPDIEAKVEVLDYYYEEQDERIYINTRMCITNNSTEFKLFYVGGMYSVLAYPDDDVAIENFSTLLPYVKDEIDYSFLKHLAPGQSIYFDGPGGSSTGICSVGIDPKNPPSTISVYAAYKVPNFIRKYQPDIWTGEMTSSITTIKVWQILLFSDRTRYVIFFAALATALAIPFLSYLGYKLVRRIL